MIQAEERVLLAVVNQAIFDSCDQPIRVDPNAQDPLDQLAMTDDARSAFHFLLTTSLDAYLKWTDINPEWLRSSLFDVMYERRAQPVLTRMRGEDGKFKFNERQRKIFRTNHQLFLRNPDLPIKLPKENDKDFQTVTRTKMTKGKANDQGSMDRLGSGPKNKTNSRSRSVAIGTISAHLQGGRYDSAAGRWVSHSEPVDGNGRQEKVEGQTARRGKA